MSRHLLGTSVAVAALASLAAAGCQRSTPPQPAAQGAAAPAAKKPSNLKTLTLTHPGAAKVVVGTPIDATAEGLPPRRKLDLLWQTVKGGWVVEDYYHFRGKKFVETTRPLGQFETGEDGRYRVEDVRSSMIEDSKEDRRDYNVGIRVEHPTHAAANFSRHPPVQAIHPHERRLQLRR